MASGKLNLFLSFFFFKQHIASVIHKINVSHSILKSNTLIWQQLTHSPALLSINNGIWGKKCHNMTFPLKAACGKTTKLYALITQLMLKHCGKMLFSPDYLTFSPQSVSLTLFFNDIACLQALYCSNAFSYLLKIASVIPPVPLFVVSAAACSTVTGARNGSTELMTSLNQLNPSLGRFIAIHTHSLYQLVSPSLCFWACLSHNAAPQLATEQTGSCHFQTASRS